MAPYPALRRSRTRQRSRTELRGSVAPMRDLHSLARKILRCRRATFPGHLCGSSFRCFVRGSSAPGRFGRRSDSWWCSRVRTRRVLRQARPLQNLVTLRKSIKHWLYGSCPGMAGAFPYFGTRVYFPKKSLSFTAACAQGVFEYDNLRILQSLVRPDSTYFDIGT